MSKQTSEPKRKRTHRKRKTPEEGLNQKLESNSHWKVFLDEGSGPKARRSHAENARRPWRFVATWWGPGGDDRVMFAISNLLELWEDHIVATAQDALRERGKPAADRVCASAQVRKLFGREVQEQIEAAARAASAACAA